MSILVGSGITAVSEKNRSKLFTFYLCSLPNDITGDISPEELRALAYDSAKQGLSIQQIVSLLLHQSGGILYASEVDFNRLVLAYKYDTTSFGLIISSRIIRKMGLQVLRAS